MSQRLPRAGARASLSVLLAMVIVVLIAAARTQPAAQTLAPGFERMRKIDVHSHIYEDLPVVNAMLQRINLRVVNISNPGDGRPSRLHAPLQLGAREAASRHLLVRVDLRSDDAQRAGLCRALAKALDETFAQGAVMVKIWKEVGLELKRPDGTFLLPDDPVLDPIYAHLASRRKPLLAHLAEPREAWLPLDPKGVHYGYYSRNPQWHLYGKPEFPSHARLMDARDHILAKHPAWS